MKMMLWCLTALGVVAAYPTLAQDKSKRKPAAISVNAAEKCAVDDVLLTPTDEADWQGDCEEGKAKGNGVLQIMRGGQFHQKYEGLFALGLPTADATITFANGDRYSGPTLAGKPEGRGKWLLANGHQFIGHFSQGEVQGSVEYLFAQGGRFLGGVRDHRPDGRGVLELPGGDRIEGFFAQGAALVPYLYHFADGRRFFGEVAAGQPQGTGVLYLPGGSVIEGEFSGDTARGIKLLPQKDALSGEFIKDQLVSGRIFYADGWIYSGAMLDGRPAGRGELVMPGGHRVVGEFSPKRVVTGAAERHLPDRSKYTGPLAADFSPSGQGQRVAADGSVTVAVFKTTGAEGSGDIRYANGILYRGAIAAGLPAGQGEMTWPDGARYQGAFTRGLPHGQGTLTFANKTRYSGSFLAGLPDGEGEIGFTEGSYVGSLANALPEGAGNWHAASKARFKGTYRRGLRVGPGQIVLPGEKDANPVAFENDLSPTDEGPHFSLFKSKTEEIEGLVRDGFYRWALRYYQQRKAYFVEKRGQHADILAHLVAGLGQLPQFQFESHRLLAGLMLANESLAAEKFDVARIQPLLIAMQTIQRDVALVELLKESELPGNMQTALANIERQQADTLRKRIPVAIAAGDFTAALQLLEQLPAKTPPAESNRQALSDWLADHPTLVKARIEPLQALRQKLGVADTAPLVKPYRAHFADAIKDRDIDRALAIWSAAAAVGVDLTAGDAVRQLTTLVAWRIRSNADPAPLFALFEQVGAAANQVADDGLVLAWLDTLASQIGDGNPALASALIAKAKTFGLPLTHPRIPVLLTAALESRLQAYDLATFVSVLPELRSLGIDLAPAFKGRVVLLRSGPAGGSRPFPFAVEAVDGLAIENADDLAYDETLAKQVLGQARYVGLLDFHTRHVRRELVEQKPRASSFISGVEIIPNPDYAAAERDLVAIRIELAFFNASEAVKKPRAEEIKRLNERAQELEAKLRSLPATIRQTLTANYQFSELDFDVARIVPATIYLLDLETGKFRRATVNGKQSERFQTAVGIHARDEKATVPNRLDKVRQLDRTSFASKLVGFLPAPNTTNISPERDLAGLPAELAEQRTAQDMEVTREQARLGQDNDAKLSQVVASLHAEVRQRDEQAIDFIRVETDIPERNNRDMRKLLTNLLNQNGPAGQ